jgi:hypothetical protein
MSTLYELHVPDSLIRNRGAVHGGILQKVFSAFYEGGSRSHRYVSDDYKHEWQFSKHTVFVITTILCTKCPVSSSAYRVCSARLPEKTCCWLSGETASFTLSAISQ